MKTTSGYRTRQYGKGHAYYDPDDNKLPGVSTVAKVGNDKEAFIYTAADSVADWAADHKDALAALTPSQVAKAGREYYREHRYDAADRGTNIHDHAANLLLGKEIDAGNETAIVDTFLRMADEWKLEPDYLEAYVLSKRWGYMGRFDFLGKVRGVPALLDWKTGRTGIYPETALQLAGYRYAELLVTDDGTELPMPEVELTAAVWLQDDRYELVPVDAGPETWRTFYHALEVNQFMQRDRAELVLPPLRLEAAP